MDNNNAQPTVMSDDELREKAGNDVLLSVTTNSLPCDQKTDLIKKVLLLGPPAPQIKIPKREDRLAFLEEVFKSSKSADTDMDARHNSRVALLKTIVLCVSPAISWEDIYHVTSVDESGETFFRTFWLVEKIENVQRDWVEALVDALPLPPPPVNEDSLALFDDIVRHSSYGVTKALLDKKCFTPNDRLTRLQKGKPYSNQPVWYSAMSSNVLELMFKHGADLTQMKVMADGSEVGFIKHWGDVWFNGNREFRANKSEQLVKMIKQFWPATLSDHVNKIWFSELQTWMPDAAPATIRLLARKGFKSGIRVVGDPSTMSLSSFALMKGAPGIALDLIKYGIRLSSPINTHDFIRVFGAFPLLDSSSKEAPLFAKDLNALTSLWKTTYPKDWSHSDTRGRNLLGQLFVRRNVATLTPKKMVDDEIEFDKTTSTRGYSTQLWLVDEIINRGVSMFSIDDAGRVPASQAIEWVTKAQTPRGEKVPLPQPDTFSRWLINGSPTRPGWCGLKNSDAANIEKFWKSLAQDLEKPFYRVVTKNNPNTKFNHTPTLRAYTKVLEDLFAIIPPPESFWRDAKITLLTQDMTLFDKDDELKKLSAQWREKQFAAISRASSLVLSRVAHKI